jgi:L-fuconolactonase
LTATPGARRDPEERHGSAGALPSAGGLGGPVEAPHLITDAQIHLWAADTPARPWPPAGAQRAHQPHPVGKDQALAAMKDAGVDRAVIVPPSWEGERNDLALEAARLHPDRFAVMGRFPLEKPESRALVDTWTRQPGMLGMRFTFNTAEQRPWLTDGTADWLWPAVERAGIPLMMSVSGQLPAVDRIAERHPGLKLVIDHLGIRSGAKGEEAFASLPQLCTLARRPNVAVKASALPCYSIEPYPFRDVHAHIRRVYDAFGPRRTFWGTDWTRLPCPWRQAVTLFTEELPWLSTPDNEWIMGRALCEWLGWALPRGA